MAAVSGPEQMKALGLRLKALGAAGLVSPAAGLGFGKTLRAQLTAGIREAATPAMDKARQAARDELPKAGGLNEVVAASEFKVSTRLAGPSVGVRITNRSHGGRGANRGVIRHPVFGKWIEGLPPQRFPAAIGWWDKTLQDQKPEVAAKILAVLEAVNIEATRRLL